MAEFFVRSVSERDCHSLSCVDAVLQSRGLKRDRGLDCIAVAETAEGEIVATGSACGNTLRCFAVKDEYNGEGILNQLMTYLMGIQIQRGNSHVFLYTKPSSAVFFSGLGFHEIARVGDRLVFMENIAGGFEKYLFSLSAANADHIAANADHIAANANHIAVNANNIAANCALSTTKKTGCIVMNANPFTKGHRYLIEQALKQCDVLHLFIVSEDRSDFPYAVRKKLVLKGIGDLDGIIVHDSGSYIISNATFPSYFLGDDKDVARVHAALDATVFTYIAKASGISVRFVGSEPFSAVTALYNDVLSDILPKNGVDVRVIERLAVDGVPVSASAVRKAVEEKDFNILKALLPESSLEYFCN